MHCLIKLTELSLNLSNQTYFESFNQQIFFGERIALIGDNGSGKTSLLNMIAKTMLPSEGQVDYQAGITVAYVPQLREEAQLSGAELFNQSLTQALALQPDVLILDEPSNHLDQANRKSLFRLLEQFYGTLIIASHDPALLRQGEYNFWQIKQKQIKHFYGYFDHLQHQDNLEQQTLKNELAELNKEKKLSHDALMKEQQRAKSSRLKGEKSIKGSKWPTIVSQTKALRAQETSGKKKKAAFARKEELISRISALGAAEEIKPHFNLPSRNISNKALVSIQNGSIFYGSKLILNNINLNLNGQSRLALIGNNGSGKSTLVKAIQNDSRIHKEGLWLCPANKDLGYLDQHYQDLNPNHSVLDSIQILQPTWSHQQIRSHLNDFLFRKNEQVYALSKQLSGGEKARLSLAKIAARPPKLLILDELSNNLDLKTRMHVIQILKEYPGALIVISHDKDFLAQINLTSEYLIEKNKLC